MLAIKLSCRDYGFDCNFISEGDDVSFIITKFGEHTEKEHGIEYSKESLMQFIIRKCGRLG
jgi:predicted small metal-binding protein